MKDNKKKKQSAADYSKDEFLNNPIASATDATGYVVQIPFDNDEAESLSESLNLPVTAVDDYNPNNNLKSKPR